jgi:hypothetical protein
MANLHVSAIEVDDGLCLGGDAGGVLPGGHDEGVQPHGALRPTRVQLVQTALQCALRRRVRQTY